MERPICWDCFVTYEPHLMRVETDGRFACDRTGLLHVERDIVDLAWEQWVGLGHFGPPAPPAYIAGPFQWNRAWRRRYARQAA